MKFLVDAQLPPQLCTWLSRKKSVARHVSELQYGVTTPDEKIWEIAKKQNEIIITKDKDFPERALVSPSAPQIIHIASGNSTTKILMNTLNEYWSEIESALKSNAKIIIVGRFYLKILE